MDTTGGRPAMQHVERADLAAEAVKALPVVGAGGAIFGGLSIPDWAALAALLYTLCLLIQMGYRFVVWARDRRARGRQRSRRREDK